MQLLHLLRGVESISSLRDRHTALTMATTAIIHLLKPVSFCCFGMTGGRSLTLISHSDADAAWFNGIEDNETIPMDTLYQHYPEALEAVTARKQVCRSLQNQHIRVVLPLFTGKGDLTTILIAECSMPLDETQQDGIQSFARFYTNYLGLLDYSEIDTLTGLSNRKTFDDSLERLLEESSNSPNKFDQRKSATDERYWLAVIDIDHFKKINDTWGHLFGDETLIRFSTILKRCFRQQDRLFRFGGEEFIVIIRAKNHDEAENSFERFRKELEKSEFPQTGNITCSIGFTCLDSNRPSVDILGCADQALYFAKSNGRNQTCNYESLVANQLIATINPVEGNTAVDFDIDSLFG